MILVLVLSFLLAFAQVMKSTPNPNLVDFSNPALRSLSERQLQLREAPF